MKDIKKCPECGCEEIGKGKLLGFADLVPQGKVLTSSPINAEVCTNCGIIIRLIVKEPQKFKQNK